MAYTRRANEEGEIPHHPFMAAVAVSSGIDAPISGQLEFIFPSGRNLKKHSNELTANVALKRMGYGGLLVAHGLRALASTTLNEQGFDPDVIEAALYHVGKNEG